MLKRFLRLNADLLVDGKFDFSDKLLDTYLSELLENPFIYRTEGVGDIIERFFTFLGRHKAVVMVDDHNELFKGVKIQGQENKFTIPADHDYFKKFTTWPKSRYVSFLI